MTPDGIKAEPESLRRVIARMIAALPMTPVARPGTPYPTSRRVIRVGGDDLRVHHYPYSNDH